MDNPIISLGPNLYIFGDSTIEVEFWGDVSKEFPFERVAKGLYVHRVDNPVNLIIHSVSAELK